MKSKVAIIAALFLGLTTAGASAFGIGLQFNGNAGEVFAPGVALTVRPQSVPLVFAFNWNFQSTQQMFGLTADYWAINPQIGAFSGGSMNWFLGVGFFGNLTLIQDQDMQLTGGMRIPVGLNMYLLDGFFEPFVQIAPSFGLRLVPSLGAENLFWPVSAGLRFWFR